MSDSDSNSIQGYVRKTPLAQQVESPEQLMAISDEDLMLLLARHEAECVKIQGLIEFSADQDWARRARSALRQLNIHQQWILREQKRRSQEVKLQIAKEYAILGAAKRQDMMDRRRAAADKNMRDIEVFKEVAREVLGMEMYSHLWELTEQRLAATS